MNQLLKREGYFDEGAPQWLEICKNVLELGKSSSEVPLQFKEAILLKGSTYIKEAFQALSQYPEDRKWLPLSFLHTTLVVFHENFTDISISAEDSLTYIAATIDTIQRPNPVGKDDVLRKEILSCLLFHLIYKSKSSSKHYSFDDFSKYCKIILETFESIDKDSLRLIMSYFLFARLHVFEGKMSIATEVLQFTMKKLDQLNLEKDPLVLSLTVQPTLFMAFVLKSTNKEMEANQLISKLLAQLEKHAEENPNQVVGWLNNSREDLPSEKFPELWNEVSDFQLSILQKYQDKFEIQEYTYQLILKAVNLYHLDKIIEAAQVSEKCEEVIAKFARKDTFTATRARFQLLVLNAYLSDKLALQAMNPAVREARYLEAGKMLFKAWRSTEEPNYKLLLTAKLIAISQSTKPSEIFDSIKQIIRSDNEEAYTEIEKSVDLLKYVETIPEEMFFPVWSPQ